MEIKIGESLLPKDQAKALGDAIIEQAQLGTLRHHKTFPVRIPLLCRCRELKSLSPPIQADVIHQATLELRRNWSFIFLLLTWVVIWACVYWTLWTYLHSFSVLVPTLLVVNWVVLKLLRGLFMRRNVRKIASRLQG